MKCYGFDDNVIMSGLVKGGWRWRLVQAVDESDANLNVIGCSANLSHDYFTNRQDRYVEFASHPALADYFSSLLSTVASLSYKVTATDTTTLHPQLTLSWPPDNLAPDFLASPHLLPDYKNLAGAAFASLTSAWARRPLEALAAPLPPPLASSPSPASFTPAPRAAELLNTSIRPLLQMGPFGVRHETETVVPAIFRTANALATAPGGNRTTLHWTSGYFSIQERYREAVLACEAQVRIVVASPEVSGASEVVRPLVGMG